MNVDMVTTAADYNIVEDIQNHFHMNSQQSCAFRIIAYHFLQKYTHKDPGEPSLRMLMTGPGRTGKTHVVRALKEVITPNQILSANLVCS